MIRRRRMMNRDERGPANYRQNDRGYRYARPRTSRNFYINVSNNSSRNNSKQLKPATTTTTNQTRPWLNRRQPQVGQTGGKTQLGGYFWGLPKVTDIIHGYSKGGAGVAKKKGKNPQKGGIVADSRKLARKAMRYNLQYYKRKNKDVCY